jgi:hypothetical protein
MTLTAKEFYLSETGWKDTNMVEEFDHPDEVVDLMKAYAKYQVEQAVKAIQKKAKLHIQFHDRDTSILVDTDYSGRDQDGCWCEFSVDAESIISAYPLIDIK